MLISLTSSSPFNALYLALSSSPATMSGFSLRITSFTSATLFSETWAVPTRMILDFRGATGFLKLILQLNSYFPSFILPFILLEQLYCTQNICSRYYANHFIIIFDQY